LGLLPKQTADKKNTRVVDTALWVMPERYHPSLKEAYKFILLIEGTDWGLAVDSVAEAIKLKPDQIKWRTPDSKRQWLAGTVIGHMCALLDIRAMGRLLDIKE
jgi:purine-binding chemotaxis protein CheW